MAGLFEENQWLGEFFVNEEYEKRFVGEVDYSPENGVILSYSITDLKILDEVSIVHGVFSTGKKCTLVGKFVPQYSGLTFKDRLITRNGKAGFSCLVIGEWLEDNELFFSMDFSQLKLIYLDTYYSQYLVLYSIG